MFGIAALAPLGCNGAMLKSVLVFTSVMVIAWWVRDGDARALKHELVAFGAAKTHFVPDDAAGGSDWGDN